jgi:cell division septal protein FtsQ
MATPCELITQQLGSLFTCSPINESIRIQTPFLYPDGDIIDLFYKDEDKTAILTDLGETLRWLKMQTATLRRTPKQRQLITDICLNHDIEIYRGMLMARVRQAEDLAPVLMRLSQGTLKVSDLWFTWQ